MKLVNDPLELELRRIFPVIYYPHTTVSVDFEATTIDWGTFIDAWNDAVARDIRNRNRRVRS